MWSVPSALRPPGLLPIAASSYNRPRVAIPMNGSVLRLLDANANRAREGLRVVED